jgi:hypothetical protein
MGRQGHEVSRWQLAVCQREIDRADHEAVHRVTIGLVRAIVGRDTTVRRGWCRFYGLAVPRWPEVADGSVSGCKAEQGHRS